MKVLFAGGGTMGPVTPLLAVAEAWRAKDPRAEFVWVGTRQGPEREPVRAAGIRFFHVPVARLTRYPSLEWVLLPIRLFMSFVMAFLILGRVKPDLIASAGGFTAVPVVLAGWLRRIPSWAHQPDADALLTNRLCAPFACLVTVAWPATLASFPKSKTVLVGNPVRAAIRQGQKGAAHERFGLDLRLPTVFVFGGGTGASWLNHLFAEIAAPLLERANVVHVTGEGKGVAGLEGRKRYFAAESLSGEDMGHAFAASDVVLARAGMGTVSELAATRKAAVLVPIPASGQEANARQLKEAGAAVVLSQTSTTVGDLRAAVDGLLADPARRKELGERLSSLLQTDVADELVDRVSACRK
jgi:UDP-N-acetylglucosamine--N-acetylmuramyl-(pentapeptide) pyrophosphoryl-undecaprenol N-acetylglucosamine transferase